MTSPDKTAITAHKKSTPAEAEAYADPERSIRRVAALKRLLADPDVIAYAENEAAIRQSILNLVQSWNGEAQP